MAKKKQIFVGSGEFRYRVDHEWLKFPGSGVYSLIPNLADVQGLAEDTETGELFVTFAETTKGKTPKDPAVLVFSAYGIFIRSFGPEANRGGHGIRFIKIGNEKFVFVTCVNTCQVYKYNAETGECLATYKRPKRANYPGDNFKPTNCVPLADGRVVITDGYGMSRILLYGADGQFISYFDGSEGRLDKQLAQPHGITAFGESKILIADRKNNRFVRASFDGGVQEVVKSPEFAFPCNIHQSGNMFVVPELWHSVALCDANFNILARLGDGRGKHQHSSHLANGNTGYHINLVNGTIPEATIDPNFFLYPHDAIITTCHSGKPGNILVCEWNQYRRGTGVTMLEHCPE